MKFFSNQTLTSLVACWPVGVSLFCFAPHNSTNGSWLNCKWNKLARKGWNAIAIHFDNQFCSLFFTLPRIKHSGGEKKGSKLMNGILKFYENGRFINMLKVSTRNSFHHDPKHFQSVGELFPPKRLEFLGWILEYIEFKKIRLDFMLQEFLNVPQPKLKPLHFKQPIKSIFMHAYFTIHISSNSQRPRFSAFHFQEVQEPIALSIELLHSRTVFNLPKPGNRNINAFRFAVHKILQ